MSKRSQYTPDFRKQLVERFKKSGLSADDFATAHHIKPGTFKSWLYRPKVQRPKEQDLRLLEVQTLDETASSEGIEIILGDQVYVTFPKSVAPDFLAQVLLQLAKSPC